jgi:hypothetical protein
MTNLEILLRDYARDLRRNASGGDDYPWEFAKGVADYLEVLIDRAAARPAPEPVNKMREVLEWLDRKGGLGYDAHDRIRSALTGEKA